MPKLCLVFAVNCTMSILKDKAFAKLFGTIPPANVPLGMIFIKKWIIKFLIIIASYLSWASRDVMTILAAFILPPIVSKIVIDKYGVSKNRVESSV